MTSHDPAVSSLMDRMSDIEKQRHLITMQQKEVEAKIAFATQEQRELAEMRDTMAAEETQLQKELEKLTEEQRQIDLQQMNATHRVRHTQTEEPLLVVHVSKELEVSTAAVNLWKCRFDELVRLRKQWEDGGSVVTSMAKGLRETQRRSTEMREEREQLRHQLRIGEEELRKLRALQQLPVVDSGGSGMARILTNLCSTATPVPSTLTVADVNAMQEMREAMNSDQVQWSQTVSAHQRQVAALHREVEGLTSRASELQRWLSAMEASSMDITSRRALLHHCLQCQLCPSCTTSDSTH